MASTPIGSLKLNEWFWASTRAWSIKILASPTMPDIAHTQWRSISTNFSDLLLTSMSLLEGSFFSIPNTTPSVVLTPIAVEPNYRQRLTKKCEVKRPYLNGFDRILNLVNSAFGWESVHSSIILLLATSKKVRFLLTQKDRRRKGFGRGIYLLTRDSTFY